MAYIRASSCAAAFALLFVPIIWDSFTAYQLGRYLLYGMVAQGIALCWGRTGFLPLGQALFFGLGAYVTGAVLRMDPGWGLILLAFLGSILLPSVLAGLVGILVFSRQIGSGPYFSLITLALSMLGLQLANSEEWLTGGFNGMTGIPGLPGVDSYEHLFFVIVATLLATTLLLEFLSRTPFGHLLEAIRENEERLQYFGFRTGVLKAAAFGISGGLAGLAGALYAPHQGIVTPQAVGFLLSAELVVWTAVGGRFGLIGPVAGAVAIGFLSSGLRDAFQYWELVVGIAFIVAVLRFPGGIGGFCAGIASRIVRGSPAVRRRRDHRVRKRQDPGHPDLVYRNVNASSGPVEILRDLSFEINRAGTHCIIGPNGAGKTSLINVLTGKLAVSSGSVSWKGRVIGATEPYRAARHGIGRKSQVPSIFATMGVGQNLAVALWANRLDLRDMLSSAPHLWTSGMFEELLSRFPFLHDESASAGVLSVGQRQMLDFAMTMLAEPELVLLDEPCAGLSSAETEKMIDAIAEISARSGSTFLIIEHDMRLVERLSDNVLVVHQGGLLASGTMAEIRENPNVRKVYSGAGNA